MREYPREKLASCGRTVCRKPYVVVDQSGICELCARELRRIDRTKPLRARRLIDRLRKHYPDGDWGRVPGHKYVDHKTGRSCTVSKKERKLRWDDTGDLVGF